MKFDTVIGNPPFSDGANKNLYKQIISSVIRKAEIIAMITPATWANPLVKNKVFYNTLRANGLYKYKALDSNTFPIVLETCYFICDKNKDPIDLFSYIDYNTKGYKVQMGKLYRNQAILKPNGLKCIFSAGRVNGDYDWAYIDESQLALTSGYGKHKVIFSKKTAIRKLGALKYAGPEYAVACNCGYIEVNNKAEAEQLIEYLESDKIKKLVAIIKTATVGNTIGLFDLIPKQ